MPRLTTRRVAIACLIASRAIAAVPAVAQRPDLASRLAPLHQRALLPVRERNSPFWFVPTAPDSIRIPPTYWLEGALVGGGLLGLLTASTAVALCGYDSPCHNPGFYALGGFTLGALTGFGLGALIGGQFPKHPNAAAVSPPN